MTPDAATGTFADSKLCISVGPRLQVDGLLPAFCISLGISAPDTLISKDSFCPDRFQGFQGYSTWPDYIYVEVRLRLQWLGAMDRLNIDFKRDVTVFSSLLKIATIKYHFVKTH